MRKICLGLVYTANTKKKHFGRLNQKLQRFALLEKVIAITKDCNVDQGACTNLITKSVKNKAVYFNFIVLPAFVRDVLKRDRNGNLIMMADQFYDVMHCTLKKFSYYWVFVVFDSSICTLVSKPIRIKLPA